MENRRYSNIVWDWNGTLLDDMEICIECMNILLRERSIPLLSPGFYREVFTFPVRDYFLKIGFDFGKEDFEIPAVRFVELYNDKFREAGLFENAVDTLRHCREAGFRQYVLSAQEQGLLDRLIGHYRLNGFFEAVTGIGDNYAASKLESGRAMMERLGLDKEETVMIGDTIHDHEVASALGISCLLISHGHQSATRLLSTGSPVLGGYSEIGRYINHQN